MASPPSQAIVLAAGPGQRLWPLTAGRPKAMLLAGGKPLIQYAIEALASLGVHKVVVVVGHEGGKLQSFLKAGADFGVAIEYVQQPAPSGTLDAIRLALPRIDRSQPLVLLPGHAYIAPGALDALAGAHGTTILTTTATDDHVQGVPDARGDTLKGMSHAAAVPRSTVVTTNVVLAAPALLEALHAGHLLGKEFDLALGEWAKSNPVAVARFRGPWVPLIVPWDLLRLNEAILAGHPKAATVGPQSQVDPTALLIPPVVIGEGCTIGPFAVVGPYVAIRNCTVVGAHAEVRRSILNNNVVVDAKSVLRSSVVDDGCVVGPGFIACEAPGVLVQGAILGRDCSFPPATTLRAGTIVPPETRN